MMLSIARASRPASPRTTAVFLARPSEGDPGVALLSAMLPGPDQLLDQRSQVHSLEARSGKLRVGARGLADVADQSVEPNHVGPCHVQQFFPELRILHPLGTVDRRTERCEWVLELMSHIGGEMFDIVHPVPERLAHVRDGAGEKSDFVGARRKPRYLDLASAAHPDAVSSER